MSDVSLVAEECVTAKTRPRDRIAEAARDLFHKHGIRGIGVDAIAEAAGTNKMTLYRHFASKDELIVQCLRDVAGEFDAKWAALDASFPDDPLGRLRAWVRGAAEKVASDKRGCDLANAAVELAETDHPARRVIEEIKGAQRNRLVSLCEQAGVARSELLADTLWLLVEGARVTRQSIGARGPSAKFVESCDAVIASFRAGAAETAAANGEAGECGASI